MMICVCQVVRKKRHKVVQAGANNLSNTFLSQNYLYQDIQRKLNKCELLQKMSSVRQFTTFYKAEFLTGRVN